MITDALCKPFTMGRNVYCVHSKKHINDFPELTAQKSAMNRRTLQAMLKGLNEVGCAAELGFVDSVAAGRLLV